MRVGDGYAATLAVTGYPAEVGAGWLEPLLSWPGRVDVALHIEPVPPPVAADRLRKQRGPAGVHPPRSTPTKGRLDDPDVDAAADGRRRPGRPARPRRGPKLFRVGLYLTVHARTEDELAERVRRGAGRWPRRCCWTLQPATWRQLQGWITTLPLAVDALGMRRILDTDALAAAFPFASPTCPHRCPATPPATGGVLYGVNPHSRRGRVWDRWAQDNHNSVVLARSGAGKSYFVKLEVLRNLYPGCRSPSSTPKTSTCRLADAVGGTVIRLGAPGVRINPLDLPRRRPPHDALTRRALFLHTLIAVLLGAPPPAAAAPSEAALDRAIIAAYRPTGITTDPRTWRRPAPLLRDLTATLDADDDPAAQTLAARLRAVGDRQLRRTCSTAPPPPARTGTWSCGRCGTCPTSCAPSARCSPWTRSGGTRRRHRNARRSGGWSWSTRRGC